MIVDESAIARVAADRRLLVDRLVAIDPLRTIVDPADTPRQGERSAGDPALTERDPSTLARWSSDALRLQTLGNPPATANRESGPIRFDVPLLAIGSEPSEATPSASPAATATVAAIVDHADRDAPVPTIRTAVDVNAPPSVFVPLVLQGPAWVGQEMELIVRRERADEALDNPALDHWCGEVAIDLPELGRVAGHLAFSMQGLRVRLDADDEASVATLTAATAELARAFAAIALRVSGLSVGQRAADAMRAPSPVHQLARPL